MITVELNDGTKYTGYNLNGNILESELEQTPEMFPASKLHGVKIYPTELGADSEAHDDAGMLGYHAHMKLIHASYSKPDKLYHVALADIPASQLKELETQGAIEYIAMMTGVEL